MADLPVGESLRALWYSFRYCRTPKSEGLGVAVRLVAASRLCVTPMTFYAVTIGALLAWLRGSFNWLLYVVLLAAFTASHLADNLLNDLSDYLSGIDEPGYFRSLYGPHPLIDGLLTRRSVEAFVVAVLAGDAVLAAYLGFKIGPVIPLLAVLGALSMALYAGYPVDAKRLGIGEALVGIVWGPVIAGGTLLSLLHSHPATALAVYLPYAAAVSLVLIGKHMDKYSHDKAKGVKTLPVRLGLRRTGILAATIALVAPPAAAFGAYLYTGSPWGLLPLASLATGLATALILTKSKPSTPPRGWEVWPLWYVAATYAALDSLGRILVASLLAAGLASRGALWAAVLVAAAALALEASSSRVLHSVAGAGGG